MLAIAAAIILVICLIPILHIIVGLFWVVLGLGFWLIIGAISLIVLVLFLNGTLPAGILMWGFGIFVLARFVGFLDSKSKNFTHQENRRKFPTKMNNDTSIYNVTPKSPKLEVNERCRRFIPAFSTKAKILKLQALNEIDQQQLNYQKKSINFASQQLDLHTKEIHSKLEEHFKLYLESELIRLEVVKSVLSIEKITVGDTVKNFLEGNAKEIASITVKIRPATNTRIVKKISLRLPQQLEGYFPSISVKKILRKVDRLILKELKRDPKLTEKIKIG
jgi:hypothetical protein